MNVILLAPTPPPQGGIAGWTERMLHANLKNGWKVVVVDEKVSGKRDAYNGAKKNFIDEVRRCVRIWNDLNSALNDKNSTVVQACIPAGTTSMLREIVSAIITKARKRKFIVHFRCTLPNMVRTRTSRSIFKILVKLSDCVFVLNTVSAEFLTSIVSTKKYVLIPNFIESTAIFEKKQVNSDLKRITYVGGVIEEKGCDLIADVAKHFPQKEFRLVGHIDMDTSVFPDNVVLFGEKPKSFVQNELNETDAFLFLTRFSGEGFSNALAEAMSHSLPCVVSNWAANSDMIENQGGIVLEHYCVEDVVKAIQSIENEEVRRQMGNWNRQKIIKSYSDKVVTDLYVDAYENLV